MADDSFYMKQALAEAARAAERGEVPVGAVVVCRDRILARAHNLPVCCVFLLPSEKNLTLWQTTSRSDWHRLPLLFPCLKRYITRIFYSRCQESCLIRLS